MDPGGSSFGGHKIGDDYRKYSLEELGHKEFYVAAHDRGTRTVYRMCRDHPTPVQKAAAISSGFREPLGRRWSVE